MKIEFKETDFLDMEFAPGICTCPGGGEDYFLSIIEGSAQVTHEPCGLPISDYPEDITIEGEIRVQVEWKSDGCVPPGGWHGTESRCDCSYQPEIIVVGE